MDKNFGGSRFTRKGFLNVVAAHRWYGCGHPSGSPEKNRMASWAPRPRLCAVQWRAEVHIYILKFLGFFSFSFIWGLLVTEPGRLGFSWQQPSLFLLPIFPSGLITSCIFKQFFWRHYKQNYFMFERIPWNTTLIVYTDMFKILKHLRFLKTQRIFKHDLSFKNIKRIPTDWSSPCLRQHTHGIDAFSAVFSPSSSQHLSSHLRPRLPVTNRNAMSSKDEKIESFINLFAKGWLKSSGESAPLSPLLFCSVFFENLKSVFYRFCRLFFLNSGGKIRCMGFFNNFFSIFFTISSNLPHPKFQYFPVFLARGFPWSGFKKKIFSPGFARKKAHFLFLLEQVLFKKCGVNFPINCICEETSYLPK